MSKQVVLEVTQPFHATGTEVMYQPGEQFPLGTDLPHGVRVAEVVANVPDLPEREGKPDAPPGKPESKATAEGRATVRATGKSG